MSRIRRVWRDTLRVPGNSEFSGGTLLTDLPQSAFQACENGVPQEIKVFRHEDAPVSFGPVVDNSASMKKDKHAHVAAALPPLVRASNPDDVMQFNEKSRMLQTALRDASSLGIAHLTRLAKSDRKVLVVVTDGDDNSSAADLARMSREAAQTGGRFTRSGC